MSQPTGPTRHEVLFSMSDASKARVDQLLAKCGHKSLNLLLARGLELAQWVEDQSALGHAVAAVTEDGDVMDLLEERPELLKPQPRPQAITTAVQETAPAPIVPPTPAASLTSTDNPRLMAREKSPSKAPARQRDRAPNGRVAKLNAHLPDDDGPIKTVTWLRWDCERRKGMPLIYIGTERALPGELNLSHLEALETALRETRHATHFKITEMGDLAFYGFDNQKGWCYMEDCSRRLFPDPHSGLHSIFPVVMAAEYLQRLSNPNASATKG